MKVTLYNAISLDGFIARKDFDSDWVSPKDAEMFEAKCKEVGCIIVGRITFERYPDLYPMAGVLSVVISSVKSGQGDGYEFVASPEVALALASSRGYKEVILVGGAKANAAFLNAKMIDEMILDVHPFYLGEGIGVFGDSGLAPSLELLSVSTPGDDLVQLHYRVKK